MRTFMIADTAALAGAPTVAGTGDMAPDVANGIVSGTGDDGVSAALCLDVSAIGLAARITTDPMVSVGAMRSTREGATGEEHTCGRLLVSVVYMGTPSRPIGLILADLSVFRT
jgi:hypothetical protein